MFFSWKERIKVTALMLGWIGPVILGSGSLEAAGDATKGKELFQRCVSCHGANGEGNKAQKAPRLAGQHEWYLVTQLKSFRDQKRSNPPMFPFIKDLSDKEFEDLAAFISQLKLQ